MDKSQPQVIERNLPMACILVSLLTQCLVKDVLSYTPFPSRVHDRRFQKLNIFLKQQQLVHIFLIVTQSLCC